MAGHGGVVTAPADEGPAFAAATAQHSGASEAPTGMTTSEPPSPPVQQPGGAAPRQPNLLDLLAEKARGRSGRELAVTAVGGIVNASFFGIHLGVWWLASLFIAVTAYGVWGAADRVIRERRAAERTDPTVDGLLAFAQAVSVAGGVIAALAAFAGFFLAGLPNWYMSG